MKNNYINSLVAALAVLALVACVKQEDEPTAVGDSPTFSATIEGTKSRAYDTVWENDDKIGITITDGTIAGGNVSGGGATNLSYTHQGNGLFTVTDPNQQIIFTNNDRVSFRAYYPYRSNLPATGTNKGKITSVKTTDQSDPKTFDFLYAEGEGSKTDSKVNLTFRHKMCKVTFVFKNDTGLDFPTITSFKTTGVNMTGGTFDTNVGTCTVKTSSSTATVTNAEIKVSDDETEAVTSFILIPQTMNAIPVPFQIIDDTGYVYTCDLPFSSTVIEAGKNYQFNITISTKKELTVNRATITDWETTDLGDSWEAW